MHIYRICVTGVRGFPSSRIPRQGVECLWEGGFTEATRRQSRRLNCPRLLLQHFAYIRDVSFYVRARLIPGGVAPKGAISWGFSQEDGELRGRYGVCTDIEGYWENM